MKTSILCVSMSLILGACAHSSKIEAVKPASSDSVQARRQMMIGMWRGEAATKDGQLRKSLMHRRGDGTYTVTFQLFKNGAKAEEQVEAGLWGVSADVYFTMTREMLVRGGFKPIATDDAVFYDAYNIVELTPTKFRYKSLEFGDEFTVEKVADDYRLK